MEHSLHIVRTALATCVVAAAQPCLAADPPVPQHVRTAVEKAFAAPSEAMKKELRIRDGKLTEIKATPIPGMYQVKFGPHLLYTDATGQYAIQGAVVDTRSGENLTEMAQTINWSDLPLQQAITWSKGDGSRKLALFADPECAPCKKLEGILASMDNLTIYLFITPRLGPESIAKTAQVWCSADRAKAWHDWMLEGRAPGPATSCSAPVAQLLETGDRFNVSATPTLYFIDGTRIRGWREVPVLEEKFANLKK